MANYYATIRTNYFSVKDETAFRKLIEETQAGEGEVHLFEQKQKDGTIKFGFGCQSYLAGISNSDGDDILCTDMLYERLQELVADDDAIIITEVGYEKLRYLVAFSIVITKDSIKSIDIVPMAVNLAKELLNNPAYKTQMDY